MNKKLPPLAEKSNATPPVLLFVTNERYSALKLMQVRVQASRRIVGCCIMRMSSASACLFVGTQQSYSRNYSCNSGSSKARRISSPSPGIAELYAEIIKVFISIDRFRRLGRHFGTAQTIPCTICVLSSQNHWRLDRG